MLFLGVTGMKAAVSHAPIDHTGRQKFVFFTFPHIGINDKGVLGEVLFLLLYYFFIYNFISLLDDDH